MASTTYRARVIAREHSSNNTGLAGTYNLLVAAKSIPSPVSPPNTVESTTFEDDTQTFEMGVKTADSQEITGNLDKAYLESALALEGKVLDIINLYGTDGLGGVAKIARQGKISVTVGDAGGVDEILEMSITLVPSTAAEFVTDDITVTAGSGGTFTVAAASA